MPQTGNATKIFRIYDQDNTADRLVIDASGNVGLGTTNPGVKLHVQGVNQDVHILAKTNDNNVAVLAAHGDSQGTGRLYVGQSNMYGGGIEYNGDNSPTSTGAGADYLALYRVDQGGYHWTARNYYNSNDWLFRSRIGIGTASPACPLHVNATASASVGDTHRWVTISSVSGGGSYTNKFGSAIANTSYDYSIKASGAISSPRFIIGSDERIKKDIVDVEDDEALVKLRMLHPKKYKFIDESARGAHQIYGFLANEVKEVLPDAIVEHPEEVPSIYQFANATSSNVITFSGDFNTSQLESNVLVVVGVDQVKHTLTVDEIIDSTSVRVVEDLSAVSGSLDEHGNAVTDTQTLSITPEEYEELEDKTGFEPISDDSNVITEYTKTTTTYVGDQLFVYGEVVDDFKHLQESAISTLSTAALQEVDRIQQQLVDQVADLETAVTSRDQQIDELRSELSDIVSRLESLEA